MSTKGIMAEQILRLYYGGNIPSNAHITKFDVYKLIEQFGNQELKAERFNVNLPEGEIHAPNALIASYDDVPVFAWKSKSKARLPAVPIAMPRNLGVWHISASEVNGSAVDRTDEPYIPLLSGQYGIIKGLKELGGLSGFVGYEPVNGEVIFTENIFGQGVTKVFIQLLVSDFSQIGEFDPLPITPDMEARIVASCLNMLRSMPPADRAVDGTDKR